MRRSAIVPIVGLLLSPVIAHAHALLDHADPRVGSMVATAPRTLTLWFTEQVEPSFSSIEVRDSRGVRFDRGRASVDSADRTVLRIGLKPSPAGRYSVRWRALSSDTHTTQGDFEFEVRP
jgi:methionine-rich copper-binding protein CopC